MVDNLTKQKSFAKRLAEALVAVVRLLYFRPQYLFLALLVSFIFYETIYWILNIGLIGYMFGNSSLSVLDRIEIIIGSYSGVFTYPPSMLAALLFSVSFLQGVTLAVLVFMSGRNRHRNIKAGDFKSLGLAGILSVIGLGCAACGTSLIMPIITWLFATSSVALVDTIGLLSAFIAFIISLLAMIFAGDKLRRLGHKI